MIPIAVIFHRIGPYHFARLRGAGRLVKVVAIELSNKDDTYAWDKVAGADSFKRVTLFDEDVRTQPSNEIICRVNAALNDCQPAAVAINGWASTEAFAAYQWCLNHRVPAIVMSESTDWDDKRSAWKEWIKSRIVRICSFGLAGGKAHADYLVKLGIDRSKISLGYDAVDNDYFATRTEEVRKQKSNIRKQRGLPDKFFLASARFVEKKNLSRLLDAYTFYRHKAESLAIHNSQLTTSPWSLILLGDGPLKSTLNSRLSTLNLHDHVQMPGFVQYPDLPAYYGLAGAFVHASTTEQWGLVVNEAMASGLPVLVSRRCGCAQDLVQDGVNGFGFDPFDSNRLAELMVQLTIAEPATLSSYGRESRRIIANWGPERFAIGLKKAVDAALAAPRPKTGIFDRMLLRALATRRYHAET